MPATNTVAASLPTRTYRTYQGAEGYVPGGQFTDHLDPAVQARAFELWNDQHLSFPQVASILGMHRWTHARTACDQHSRRHQVASRFIARGPRTGRQAASTGDLVGDLLNRRFGVEIEYGGDYYTHGPAAAERALRAAGLEAQQASYTHATVPHWKCTTDGSVSGGEVVSPILRGEQGWTDMRSAMRAIRAMGGRANTSCGLHIHHDVTDFDQDGMRALVANLRACQDALMNYVSARRWNGSWSPKLTGGQWDSLTRGVEHDNLMPQTSRSTTYREYGTCNVTRYVAFNFNSVLTYGTVEFRSLQGTLDAGVARAWIAVGQAVVEFSRLHRTFAPATAVTSVDMTDRLVAEGLLTRRMADRFLSGCRRLNPSSRTIGIAA